ncbi:MAG: Trk system potassium transporter TrkA [Desulfovibrionales bacterium]
MRVIIVGAGEVGSHLADKLAQENKEVVIIDLNPGVLDKISEQMDVQTIVGSGSSPGILEQAGIKDADILLAVTDSDEINLIACTFANILKPGITKLARIRNDEYTRFREAFSREMLGIELVINPEVEVVRTIQRLMGAPDAVDVSEFAEGKVRLIGIWVREQSVLAGTRLTRIREKVGTTRLIIGAIVRNEELIIPTGEDVVQAGDLIYFVCQEKDQDEILRSFGGRPKAMKNVLIIGGGNIGFRLARELEKGEFHTKLIETDLARCEFLSEALEKTVILQGDGTDQSLLKEENIHAMDVAVTVTGDEETNILCSLLAKSMDAGMTITRINNFAYFPLVRTIGIEHTVSPRQSAVNAILHHVRRGRVISAVSIKEEAEVLEAVALENSEVVDKPVKDIDFPRGAVILCIIRKEEVVIPTGLSVIHPLDRIIILAKQKAISAVEKALMVKLEKF